MTNKKMATLNMVAVIVGLASPAAMLSSAHAETPANNNVLVNKWDVPNPVSVDKDMKELSGSAFKIQVFTRDNAASDTWVEKEADKQKNDDGSAISAEDQAQSIIGAPTTVDAKDSESALTKIVYTENKAVDDYKLFKDSVTLYETTNGWVQDDNAPAMDNIVYKAVDDKLTNPDTVNSVDESDEKVNKTNTIDFKEELLPSDAPSAQTDNSAPSDASTTVAPTNEATTEANATTDADSKADSNGTPSESATDSTATATPDEQKADNKTPLKMHSAMVYKAAATVPMAVKAESANSSTHISGSVFYDYNKNGANDSNDSPAVSTNVTLKSVSLDANGNIKQVFNTYYAKTDSSGKYTFKDLDSGTYIVSVDTANTTGYTLIWHDTNIDTKHKFAVVFISGDGSDAYDNVNFGLGKNSNNSNTSNSNSSPKGTTPAVVTIPDAKSNTPKSTTSNSAKATTTPSPVATANSNTNNTLPNSVAPSTSNSSVSPYNSNTNNYNNGSSTSGNSTNANNYGSNDNTQVNTGELKDSNNITAIASGAGIMGLGGLLLGKNFRKKKK